jgi:ribosomal protein S18 acetylase RimI-like enzyme
MVCGEAQRNAGQVGGARVQIIEMDEARADDVALLFARAFQDDPILVHACPDADKRARWLPWLFRWSTWQGLRFGRLLGTAGDLDGAAALVGPGGGQFTDEDLERPGPHWYLDALAVKPERQRQGIGSVLLHAAIAYADADRLPLVLLTCQPRNVDLYKRHGFEVVCQVDSPDATVQWWGIRRHPRS